MSTRELGDMSDEELVRGLQAGCCDEEFQERYRLLHSRLNNRLRRAALRYTDGPDEAEEVAARTWPGFITSIKRFHPDRCTVWTFLYLIMRRRSADLVHEHQHERKALGHCRCCATLPDDWQRALAEAAGRYLCLMPARLAQPLLLHRLQGMDYDDVARLLGISVRQAEYRANAGLHWLQAHAPAMKAAARF